MIQAYQIEVFHATLPTNPYLCQSMDTFIIMIQLGLNYTQTFDTLFLNLAFSIFFIVFAISYSLSLIWAYE